MKNKNIPFEKKIKKKLADLLIGIIGLYIFFLCFYVLIAPGHIYTVDGGLRLKVTESIVERHTFSLPGTNGIEGKNGKYYSWYGIGQSLFSIPLYLIGKLISRWFVSIDKSIVTEFTVSFLNAFVGAAISVLIFLFSFYLGFSKKISFYLAIIYGFCTFTIVHVRDSYELQTTLFTLGAFLSLFIYTTKRNIKWLVIASFLLGFNIITRFSSFILLFPILCFLWSTSEKSILRFLKNVVIIGICLIPFAILYFYYNYLRFGTILESGYAYICLGTYGSRIALTNSYIKSLYGITFSPGKGIFIYSPILVLGLIAFRAFWAKNKNVAKVFLISIVTYILFYSIFCFWHGSICWGPRYLLPVMPFMIISIGCLLEYNRIFRKEFAKFVVILFSIVSFGIQLPAISTNYKRYYHYTTAVDNVSFEETCFNPKYSPIIGQWKMFFQVIKKTSENVPWRLKLKVVGLTSKQMIEQSRTMNMINFWYFHLYYMKFPFLLILGMVFFIIIILFFSFWLVRKKVLIN